MSVVNALRVAIVTVAGLGSATCIIPDREISFASEFDNPGAVRIVYRPPVMQEMDEICNARAEDADPTFCPAARAVSRRPGLIATAASEPFCICPSGRDNRAIAPFNIYAEDPDVERDLPKDTLFGVLLLDPDRPVDHPTDVIAYRNYLEPCGVGSDVRNLVEDPPRAVPSQAREDAPQRLFRLDDGSAAGRLDLCNDNNGDPVVEGLHNLRFMVTDRPFFRPPIFTVPQDEDEEPEPVVIDGVPLLGPQQCGVPDLASGATYATVDFVFECRLAGDETDPNGECDCADG